MDVGAIKGKGKKGKGKGKNNFSHWYFMKGKGGNKGPKLRTKEKVKEQSQTPVALLRLFAIRVVGQDTLLVSAELVGSTQLMTLREIRMRVHGMRLHGIMNGVMIGLHGMILVTSVIMVIHGMITSSVM